MAKPPAAWVGGKDKCAPHLGVEVYFYTSRSGEERLMETILKQFTPATNMRVGKCEAMAIL